MKRAADMERREIARVVTTVLFGVLLMTTFGLASLAGFLYCVHLAFTGDESGAQVMGGILAVMVALPLFLYITAASVSAMKGRASGVLMGFVPLLIISPFWLLWVVFAVLGAKSIKSGELPFVGGVLAVGLLLVLGWASLSGAQEQDEQHE